MLPHDIRGQHRGKPLESKFRQIELLHVGEMHNCTGSNQASSPPLQSFTYLWVPVILYTHTPIYYAMTLLTGGNTSVECPPLKCPDHGFVDIVNNSSFVTEAVYSCEESFVLRGDHKRYCQRNGQWTGRDPHCSLAIGEGLKGWSGVMWLEGPGVE